MEIDMWCFFFFFLWHQYRYFFNQTTYVTLFSSPDSTIKEQDLKRQKMIDIAFKFVKMAAGNREKVPRVHKINY